MGVSLPQATMASGQLRDTTMKLVASLPMLVICFPHSVELNHSWPHRSTEWGCVAPGCTGVMVFSVLALGLVGLRLRGCGGARLAFRTTATPETGETKLEREPEVDVRLDRLPALRLLGHDAVLDRAPLPDDARGAREGDGDHGRDASSEVGDEEEDEPRHRGDEERVLIALHDELRGPGGPVRLRELANERRVVAVALPAEAEAAIEGDPAVLVAPQDVDAQLVPGLGVVGLRGREHGVDRDVRVGEGVDQADLEEVDHVGVGVGDEARAGTGRGRQLRSDECTGTERDAPCPSARALEAVDPLLEVVTGLERVRGGLGRNDDGLIDRDRERAVVARARRGGVAEGRGRIRVHVRFRDPHPTGGGAVGGARNRLAVLRGGREPGGPAAGSGELPLLVDHDLHLHLVAGLDARGVGAATLRVDDPGGGLRVGARADRDARGRHDGGQVVVSIRHG